MWWELQIKCFDPLFNQQLTPRLFVLAHIIFYRCLCFSCLKHWNWINTCWENWYWWWGSSGEVKIHIWSILTLKIRNCIAILIFWLQSGVLSYCTKVCQSKPLEISYMLKLQPACHVTTSSIDRRKIKNTERAVMGSVLYKTSSAIFWKIPFHEVNFTLKY